LTKKAPYKGLGADSEEKHEAVSDIDTIVVDGLKALDPEWPIREATLLSAQRSDTKRQSRHFSLAETASVIAMAAIRLFSECCSIQRHLARADNLVLCSTRAM
jgi:hypothetical protein